MLFELFWRRHDVITWQFNLLFLQKQSKILSLLATWNV
jgi:hypothetical protein